MVKDSTLYNRLGIQSDANDEQIKKAFNQLSKKWHPDKNPDNLEEANVKFHEITEAKDILLDNDKRKIYDQIGMDILNINNQQMGSEFMDNPFSQFGGFPFNMGGMGGMGGMKREKQVSNITEHLNVTLEQIYNEETVNFTYKYKVSCSNCNGEGTKDGKPNICPECNGNGIKIQVIKMGNMIQQASSTCHNCNGSGKISNNNNKCTICIGKCVILKDKTIQVPLKSGLVHGNKIQLGGKGNQIKNVKSDLILVINELSHNIFKRNNNDLFITIDLKLYQVLFGYDKKIIHLDGRKIHITNTGKTDLNIIRKINGEGLKIINSNNKGNLYIKFNLILPNLTLLSTDNNNNLKLMLQSLDKQEFMNENNFKNESNLIKTLSIDCKQEEINNINDILYNINKLKSTNKQNNQTDSDEEQDNRNMPGQQCVQQ
jgi:DnaJ-class molecular chaperone